MTTRTLGWQSWSPPYPNLLHIPRRDYYPQFRPLPKARTHKKLSIHHKLTYWCSWYALGWHINPTTLLEQARLIRAKSLPIDYFLLDDGWDSSWLPQVTQTLHHLGFRVGLWYAPYTRHRHLPLVSSLERLITSCQIDLLKLDFLYKPYFDPKIANPSKMITKLFAYLQIHHPLVKLIGCGVPFSDAIGHVDFIRLSKDTAFPPPMPTFLNRAIYLHRLTMLFEKYQVWQLHPTFVADPDVRMFSLDSPTTDAIWSRMAYSLKGLGDDLTKLSDTQIQKAIIWLKS